MIDHKLIKANSKKRVVSVTRKVRKATQQTFALAMNDFNLFSEEWPLMDDNRNESP